MGWSTPAAHRWVLPLGTEPPSPSHIPAPSYCPHPVPSSQAAGAVCTDCPGRGCGLTSRGGSQAGRNKDRH